MEEEELEGEDLSPPEQAVARPPVTGPDVKEEGPVELNEPGPADMPGRSSDPEGAMLERSPLERGRPPPALGRLIPAGMEDSYVTTLTQRVRGWLARGRSLSAYSTLAHLSPPSSLPSYADRGTVPVAALVTEREIEVPGATGGARPRAKPAVICGDHPTRPDLIGPDSPWTPWQYRAPDPEEMKGEGTPTLTEELGAVRRGLERVAQHYAPPQKWHGSMNLKLVEPPYLVDLLRLDGSRLTVPVECGPGTVFARGLWQNPPKVNYLRFALALGLKNV